MLHGPLPNTDADHQFNSVRDYDVPLDLAGMILDDLPAGAALPLLFGDEEHRIFRGKGGERAIRAAGRRGVDARVGCAPAFDHSLFSLAGRRRVETFLRDLVRGRAVSS